MRAKDLEIDFIGGQGPLTKEEEQAISEYLKKENPKNSKLGRRQEKKDKSAS